MPAWSHDENSNRGSCLIWVQFGVKVHRIGDLLSSQKLAAVLDICEFSLGNFEADT